MSATGPSASSTCWRCSAHRWACSSPTVYKQLKLLQDADLILAECRELVEAHALDPAQAREVVVKAMLADQPLPLRSGRG